MTEINLKNKHLNTIVVIATGKIHQWLFKLMIKSLREKIQDRCIASKVTPPKYLLIALVVLRCMYIRTFFNTSPSRRWSSIPLSRRVLVSWTSVTLILRNGEGKVVLSLWRNLAYIIWPKWSSLPVPTEDTGTMYPNDRIAGEVYITTIVLFPKSVISI